MSASLFVVFQPFKQVVFHFCICFCLKKKFGHLAVNLNNAEIEFWYLRKC